MKTINKWKTTSNIRYLRNNFNNLNDLLKKVTEKHPSWKFWKKNYSIDEIIRVVNNVSIAENKFWDEIYHEYPETFGKKIYCTEYYIAENKDE